MIKSKFILLRNFFFLFPALIPYIIYNRMAFIVLLIIISNAVASANSFQIAS